MVVSESVEALVNQLRAREAALKAVEARLAEAEKEQKRIIRDSGLVITRTRERAESAEADRARETAVVKQLSTILGTIRPLDVMGQDEDLSIGECADRWEERAREMVAGSIARAALEPEQQP
jgi:hypothetical protein